MGICVKKVFPSIPGTPNTAGHSRDREQEADAEQWHTVTAWL